MLFNLILANMTILLCFFFKFLVAFNSIKRIENVRPKRVVTIPTGAQITVTNDPVEMLPVFTDRRINDLSIYSKEIMHLLSLLSLVLFL